MRHLNEEELIEHYCRKEKNQHFFGDDREREVATEHVAECGQCEDSYNELEADLFDLAPFDPPHRDPEYGRRVWESIAGSLPERPRRRQLWMSRDLWRGLAYTCAATVLLAATFYAGRMWEHSKTPVTSTRPAASAPAAPKRVVVVLLGDHLERTERLLVELKHTDVDDSDMLPPLRDEARNLLPANRICLREAEKSDDTELEQALSALNRVLTDLADQPRGLDPAEVTRLQMEMNADGLLFEVRVLRSRIPVAEQATSTASEGGKI